VGGRGFILGLLLLHPLHFSREQSEDLKTCKNVEFPCMNDKNVMAIRSRDLGCENY
jgi:hypothetical protein